MVRLLLFLMVTPSTKDIKHQVREAKLSQIVTVDVNKKVNTSQEKFLKNKTKLVSFLRDILRKYGFRTFEAPADADTLIAKVAVQ